MQDLAQLKNFEMLNSSEKKIKIVNSQPKIAEIIGYLKMQVCRY